VPSNRRGPSRRPRRSSCPRARARRACRRPANYTVGPAMPFRQARDARPTEEA
jgi:hypothetical protein